MSNYDEHLPDEALERYLDGQLSGKELEAFELRIRNDAALQAQIETNGKLVERLQFVLRPQTPSVDDIEQFLVGAAAQESGTVHAQANSSSSRWRKTMIAVLCGVAALLASILASQQFGSDRRVSPYFQQRPLAELYQEAIGQGFRPYYFCEDQERFARTFRKRQATPLVLAQLPSDRHMVGLSYPGGLSRNTTAMLAYVAEQPVIVFVDRALHDNVALATTRPDDQLFVHRAVLDDLVLYEVSPFGEPKMTPYLRVQGATEQTAR